MKDKRNWLGMQWARLVGDPEKFTIQSRIFHGFCVFGISINFIETVSNVFNGLYSSVLITAFIGFFQVACYYMSRFKNKGKLAILLSNIEIILLTALAYFYNSGIEGSTLLIFIIVLFVIILVVQPKQWLYWYAVNVIVVLSMVILEYYRPNVIQEHYADRKAMFIDVGIAYIIVATALFVCTMYLRKKYQEQVILTEDKALKLQQLHNEKDKLFSIISHDLNAPLAALKQYLSLLNDVELGQAERILIEQDLVKSVDNTQELLHNLLHWSKSQMKEVVVNLQELNLQQALKSTLDSFAQIALNKKIDLTAAISSDLWITADTDMLQLIVRNLINNAIKFTPVNGKIWVKALIENDRCVLSVTDNGVGIPAEKQNKIFSPAIESTAGTKQETGSGLGLLLVNDYTEMQQGKIGFTSEPGAGTSFYISLPGKMENHPHQS